MTTSSQSAGGPDLACLRRRFVPAAAGALSGLQALTFGAEHWLAGMATPLRLAVDIALTIAATGAVVALAQAIFHVPLRRARADLQRSERLYRTIAADSTDIICMLGRSGLASIEQRAAATLLGYDDAEACTLPLRKFIHPEDRLVALRHLQALGPEQPRASLTMRLQHRAGHVVLADVCLRRIEQANGEVDTVATVRDITGRHREAEALRQATLTAQRAQAEADKASRAKTDFLASMSHEIRSPLNSVIGFADLLLARPGLDGEIRLCGERIRAAGNALLTVVDDILDFSRIEAGVIELSPAPFAMPGLVDECVSIVHGEALAKRICLHVNLMDRLPAVVLGDKARVRQVLLNLLYNAIKFTHEGSVCLDIRAERGAGDGMRFSIIDTGIGIARADLPRLFQRFAQVDGSIRRTYGGTGLGLAISKRLVELMGGTIGVDSLANVGSTFWFTLPLPAGEIADAPPAPAAPAVGPARILLVDDIAMNQDLVRFILEAKGHQVDVVGNGAEAIMAVQDASYDIVLMDIQMPYVDGLTTTRTIRRLPHSCRDVPIVAVTANALPEQTEDARRAGMVDIVHKPFSADQIYAVLARVLGGRSLAIDWAAKGAAEPRSNRHAASTHLTRVPPGAESGSTASDGPVTDVSDVDLPAEPIRDAREPFVEMPVLGKLAGLIGDAKVKDLLASLAASLATRFEAAPDTADARTLLKRQAHASVAGSGMLGFAAFAASCRAFETAAEDADFPAACASLRDEATRVAEAAIRLAHSTGPLAARCAA